MLQLPDGTITMAFEISRDFAEGVPFADMAKTWEPLPGGDVTWEVADGWLIETYRCHFRSLVYDGAKYIPDYDRDPELLEVQTR